MTAQSTTTPSTTANKRRFGWKFLTPYGTTEQYYTEYALPAPGEKWGAWMEHPEPAEPDGRDCGAGRWHVMKRIDACYAPENWWVWYAEVENVVGASEKKLSATRIRLRRVRKEALWRMIRFGWCAGVNLSNANLRNANLRNAKLSNANLFYADLSNADLRNANLRNANLRNADLRNANLRNANLFYADLSNADLRNAKLSNANLFYADLSNADLRNADLSGTKHNQYTRWPDGYPEVHS